VPCKASALIAAISAANSHGGATISLGSRCTYHLTAANNTDPMLGATGLPVITSRITLNGFHTTIAGCDTKSLGASGTRRRRAGLCR
jgi:hypothetical protein